jgi:PAS domain S-box-containing protein
MRCPQRWPHAAIAAGLVLSFSLPPAVCEARSAEPTTLAAVAGVPALFPPHYEVDAAGRPVGFAVDAMDAIAAAASVSIEYRVFDDWSLVFDALRAGDIDLVPNLGISEERLAFADFTRPLEVFAIGFFVRADSDIRAPAELTDRQIGVVGTNIAARLLDGREDLLTREFASPEMLVRELLAGRIDAFAYPSPVMWSILQELRVDEAVRELSPPLREVKRAVAVARGRPELLARLQVATDAFVDGPSYQAVYSRWFGRPTPYWTARRVAWLGAGVVLLVALLLAAWRYRSVHRLVIKLNAEATERRRAEADLRALTGQLEARVRERTEELRQSEERQRTVLAHLSAGVVVHAPDSRVVYCNRLAQTLLGLDAEHMCGTTADASHWHFVTEQGEPMSVADYPVNRILESGRPLADLIMGVIPPTSAENGGITWLMVDGVPIKGDDGRIIEIVITFVDITEQRVLAEQNRQLDRFDALGRLTAGVAHELNNPLMGIINAIQYCRSPQAEPELQAEVLEQAEHNTRRCVNIVGSLLAFAHNGSGERREFIQSDVSVLVDHVLRLLQFRARKEGVQLVVQADAELPAVWLQPEPFQQLLTNLLTNAMDALEGEAVDDDREKIVTVQLSMQGASFVLRVTDPGPGIPPDEQRRIFDPFYTTKPTGKGTGLGLSNCWSIVHDHRGQLRCQSRPGEGTTMEVRLPAHPQERRVEGIDDSAREAPAGLPSTG